VAPDGPPIRRIQEIKPQSFLTSPSGNTLIDLGQNLVGWLRLSVEGPAGTNITLRHAEVLVDGELALEPLRSAKQEDSIILHGNGPQTWEPRFTFHGFRFVQVDGWPEETPLDENAVTAIVVHSDIEQTGSFASSNDLLNQFHSNVRWSMKGNFLSVPTDCPQRDERLGWTGDAHAFGPTANFLYDAAAFGGDGTKMSGLRCKTAA
jgi:alpha-L-rhamnosidase